MDTEMRLVYGRTGRESDLGVTEPGFGGRV